ncbi:Putative restriction endonuclease domain-containing protein [Tumidithrix helvetica PCC 7403]|uniref:Uma2 family endonuclease n=1 Tax=Tumidithrix helvetica TaxID=3457545 RepID=UPI003CBFA8D8
MIHLSYDPKLQLPTSEQLPHSDDTPVDNELQNDIPNFILNLLRRIWEGKQDWFFGVDMAIHYNAGTPAIVPDGFLALGVPRHKSEGGRLSYVLWEEANIMPILALEVISETYNSEYEKKLTTYQEMGVLYYIVYNPLTTKKRAYKDRLPLEIYQLVNGEYVLLSDRQQEIVWLEQIQLGLGCEVRENTGWTREWLYLYDRTGKRYLTDKETAEQERLAKEKAEQKAQRLAEKLRSLGLDPDEV